MPTRASVRKKAPRSFHPTREQVAQVGQMLEDGYSIEEIRETIIQPFKGVPLTKKAFAKHFGSLISESSKSRKGSPDFMPTEADRSNVRILVAFGIPLERVAFQVVNPATQRHIDVRTLKLHFDYDIKTAKDSLVRDVGRAARVAATRFYDSQMMKYLLDRNAPKDEESGAADSVLIVPADGNADWEAVAKAQQERLVRQAQQDSLATNPDQMSQGSQSSSKTAHSRDVNRA